jgi:hypothetical protein
VPIKVEQAILPSYIQVQILQKHLYILTVSAIEYSTDLYPNSISIKPSSSQLFRMYIPISFHPPRHHPQKIPTLNRIQQLQTTRLAATKFPKFDKPDIQSSLPLQNNHIHNVSHPISTPPRTRSVHLIAHPIRRGQAIIHINEHTAQLGVATERVQTRGMYI